VFLCLCHFRCAILIVSAKSGSDPFPINHDYGRIQRWSVYNKPRYGFCVDIRTIMGDEHLIYSVSRTTFTLGLLLLKGTRANHMLHLKFLN
jgi:hypothetical protein